MTIIFSLNSRNFSLSQEGSDEMTGRELTISPAIKAVGEGRKH
jgi:hypothetical protein